MDIYEQAVLQYISAPVWRFVNPQMALPYEVNKGESCPDFVVLDFRLKTFYVVEVTVASNITAQLKKIKDREKRWYSPLRQHISQYYNSSYFTTWNYRVTLFIRADMFEHANAALMGNKDVPVCKVETTFQGWTWNWGEDNINPLETSPDDPPS
ncbi:MAG: hypothetical protein ACRETA_06750 [Gammaproteobacteria bacterium]